MKGRHFLALAAAALLVACTPLMKTAAVADRDPLRRAVVDDVAEGMGQIFEAANTTLIPSRTMSGSFDTALVAALRRKGFRIESSPSQGEVFDCRVDPIEGLMYRVTVHVGKSELSRLWVLDGSSAYAGGAWVRRE